ncbi:Golgi membrane protein 1 isoform X2 [Mugil cephalus]|uniref:Golgi membrane protein 1 isoform X2 n=1 Tax=Mugil cephalus TaxID=48193 RepID=UPI001FB81CB6|nr:Golgi membrane protein 1 isoform X2 [Mugil cephalus]
MGGLGNGRRGGRSPPLMIAALIACILVLGFNYWVSSSRSLELQTKLYELEGQVRRGAAERGVVEMKKNEFQGEIQRQKEQISHIESFYKKQLEEAQSTCSQDKMTLQLNISSSAKAIQELKGQLNQLSDDLGRVQKELQSCQGNINTLNNKLTYDMTSCHSQVLSQKEQCDERVAAAKLEVQKKMEKLIPVPGVSSQENKGDGAVKDDKPVKTDSDRAPAATVVSHTPILTHSKETEPPELLTNEITVDRAPSAPVELLPAKDFSKTESPTAAAVKQDVVEPQEGAIKTDEVETETSKLLKNNLTENKGIELMDAQEDGVQTEEADPGMEGMLIGRGKADDNVGLKLDEPDEYDADEQVVGGVDLEKQQQSKRAENIDMEEDLADYNGDDENEGEFEADKQAELAQI